MKRKYLLPLIVLMFVFTATFMFHLLYVKGYAKELGMGYKKVAHSTLQPFPYESQVLCESESGRDCVLEICGVVPLDEEFDNVCGDGGKGWYPKSDQ